MGRESYLVDFGGGEIRENTKSSSTESEEISSCVTGTIDRLEIERVTSLKRLLVLGVFLFSFLIEVPQLLSR